MPAHRTLLAFASVLAWLAPASADALARSFACEADCPVAIADANAGVSSQTLASITLGAGACDGATAIVTGVGVDLLHNAVGDLTLELLPPVGAPVQLMARLETPGGAAGSCHGDDLVTTFTDTAPLALCRSDTIPATAPQVRANGTLGALAGISAAGNWQLRITDAAPGGYGVLTGWSLHLECNLSSDLFSNGFE